MKMETQGNRGIESDRVLGVERAENVLKGIIIPPRPSVLVRVLEEQGANDPDLHKIGDIISSDVALSASMLKIVNSPFFGLRRRVGSVHHAVSLLGVSNIVHVVTGLMLHSAFRGEKGPFMDEFWRRSSRVALLSALVARKCLRVPSEEAYAVGLFLDCGVPLLNQRYEGYPKVFHQGLEAPKQTLIEIEDTFFGTDHTLAGFLVGKSWKLPDHFCQVILRHHDLNDYYSDQKESVPEFVPMLAVMSLSQHLERLNQGLGPSCEWQRLGDTVIAFLGLREAEILQLSEEASCVES